MSVPLPKYFPNLTPLRGVAALAVVFFHKVTIFSGINPDNGGYEKVLDAIFNKGNMGVNFFFTLSGFLITYLMIRERQLEKRFRFGNFMMRRVLRIWPVYFIVTAFGFLVYPVLTGVDPDHNPLWFLTFLSNFDEIKNGLGQAVHSLTVLWSVSIEEQFYLVWAIIPGLFALHPRRHYPAFFITIVVVSVTFRLANIDNERVLYYHTLSVVSDMALGGLLAHSVIYRNPLLDFVKKLPVWGIVTIYLVGIAYCLGHNVLMKGELYAFDRLITGLFWCFIISEQCFAEHSPLKTGRLKWLNYLGKISYGIYAYHLIVFFFLNEYLAINWRSGLFMDLIANTMVVTLVTIVVAGISYRFIERPFIELKARFR